MSSYNMHIGKYVIRKRGGCWEGIDGYTGVICYGGNENYGCVDGKHLLQVLQAIVLAENLDVEEWH